jgi:Ice-binding-like
MANRNYASGGKIYSMHVKPVLVDCNFVVDSTNGNGLGIRSLKGPLVANVFMHTTATPGRSNGVLNPNPAGPTGGSAPVGSPNLGTSAGFAILAAAAITGSTGAGSVVTGDMGIYPNTLSSITNFPPSTVVGTTHAADPTANQALIDATAAFTDLTTRTSTPISATLDGVTLTPGVYTESSGTFNLAQSGNGTLTFNGAGVYVIHAASTLTTGAGGIPTMTFINGASAANVYWVCGSSATINVGVSSAGATFSGTVIAQASVTATQAGTVNGRMFALTAAVTLSDTNAVNLTTNPPATGGGVIVVQLQDNYNRSFTGFKAIVSPVSGTSTKVDNSALTAGTAYIITTLGNTTAAQWKALGVPTGTTPAVGVSFVAASVGAGANTSTSRVMTTAPAGSGIATIETVGDPNKSIAPDPTKNQGFGAQFILECRDYAGAKAAPADGTVISLAFYLSDSGVALQGE